VRKEKGVKIYFMLRWRGKKRFFYAQGLFL